jgi:hypothetical protein
MTRTAGPIKDPEKCCRGTVILKLQIAKWLKARNCATSGEETRFPTTAEFAEDVDACELRCKHFVATEVFVGYP